MTLVKTDFQNLINEKETVSLLILLDLNFIGLF